MKRRAWLWFIASALLAILAGVVSIFILQGAASRSGVPSETPGQVMVVARQPLAANSVIGIESVRVEERHESVSGAAVRVEDVLNWVTLRDFAEGAPIVMQDLAPSSTSQISGTHGLPLQLGDDKIAVALPANDILSQWGAVARGDHVDVLFTIDIVLETPLPVAGAEGEEGTAPAQGERDQSLDRVSVLTLQNLEVLQVIEEPQAEAQGEEAAPVRKRALILKIDPQDAVVLKYLRDSVAGTIDLALRSPQNSRLFDVQAVNINYLVLRYGIKLPQPIE
jgi:Flp pilus assembly protein CpaB